MRHSIRTPALFLILLMACSSSTEPFPGPSMTSITTPSCAPVPTREPPPIGALNLALIYPGRDSELEMGTSTRLAVQVTNVHDEAVDNATLRFTLLDLERKTIARLPAFHGSRGIYRTGYWTPPHRARGGTWDLRVEAEAPLAEGACSGTFTVTNSTSEILLAKYGFWLAAPHLINADLQVGAERGDARNGMIRWGGAVPGMHITPANYVEVHWRDGLYSLESPEDVRRFMLEEIGDLGDARTVSSIRPMQFKQWDAWKLECSTYTWEETVCVIFHAPQVDKTYDIATILRLPPKIPNPHGELRESFAVYPQIDASGVAPAPLPRLLPGPELVSPALAARFRGLDQPVILQWKPLKELEADEYYNGSWATDPDIARRRLARLQEAGLDDILFSVDAFHQAHVPLERIAIGIEAARALGYSTIHVDNRFLGEGERDNPHNQRTRASMVRLAERCDLSGVTVYQGPARMVGRAADELRHLPPAQDTAADHCPLLDYLGGDLRNPTGVEIHPGGWVNFCAGVALGNAHERPLERILADYEPDAHPIVRVLAHRGPAGLLRLAQRHGYVPAEDHVDGCHLCYEARRFLRPHYPKSLAPAHPYLPG